MKVYRYNRLFLNNIIMLHCYAGLPHTGKVRLKFGNKGSGT